MTTAQQTALMRGLYDAIETLELLEHGRREGVSDTWVSLGEIAGQAAQKMSGA